MVDIILGRRLTQRLQLPGACTATVRAGAGAVVTDKERMFVCGVRVARS